MDSRTAIWSPALGLLRQLSSLTDEQRREKLGPHAPDHVDFPPINGYRLGESGGRRFDSSPGAAGTNVVMRTARVSPSASLIRTVGDGIYVGRICTPIRSTANARRFHLHRQRDSYLIRNGEISEPLAPNCLRITRIFPKSS